MRLAGKAALITGASSGIGRAVAKAFAEDGARFIAVNFPDDSAKVAAEEVVKEVTAFGATAIAVKGDVSSESDVQAMVDETLAAAGNLDILVNNAGIAHADPVEDLATDTWDRVLGVHLRGTFLVTRAVLPGLYAQGHGKIINTASQLAYLGAPGLAAYTAAKGGIISLTRTLALEIGDRNIRVNCVAPGATETPILDDVEPEVLEAVRQSIPVGHLAKVEDIAPAYVFLASRDGDHFQGQVISPNGGDCFL